MNTLKTLIVVALASAVGLVLDKLEKQLRVALLGYCSLRLVQTLWGFDTVIFPIWPPRAHPAQPMAQSGRRGHSRHPKSS